MNRVSGYSFDHDGSSSSTNINELSAITYKPYSETTTSEMNEKEGMKDGSSSSGDDSTSASGSSNSNDKKKKEKPKQVGVTEIVSFIKLYVHLSQLQNSYPYISLLEFHTSVSE